VVVVSGSATKDEVVGTTELEELDATALVGATSVELDVLDDVVGTAATRLDEVVELDAGVGSTDSTGGAYADGGGGGGAGTLEDVVGAAGDEILLVVVVVHVSV